MERRSQICSEASLKNILREIFGMSSKSESQIFGEAFLQNILKEIFGMSSKSESQMPDKASWKIFQKR